MNRWTMGGVLAGLVLVTGCQQEDVTPPNWDVVVNGMREGSQVSVAGGQLIAVSAEAYDNEELAIASLRLEPRWMHPELYADFALTFGDWAEDQITELTRSSALVGRNWLVPDSVRGDWVLTADLQDAAGLSAPTQTFYVRVSNTGLAEIALDSLNGFATGLLPAVPTLTGGEALKLQGEVFDADGLNEVRVSLATPSGFAIEEWVWPAPGGIALDLSEVELTLPTEVEEVVVHMHVLDGSLQPAHARFNVAVE